MRSSGNHAAVAIDGGGIRGVLTLSSCMAPDMDGFCRRLAGYLAARLEMPVKPHLDLPWQEREKELDDGRIDLCWICGLPYVRRADTPETKLRVFVAPVMKAERYQNRPIYFSDVIVRQESRFHSLDDLRGASWTYNEPGSHSGYNLTRYVLARRGETGGFFGRVVASGAHQISLEMVLRREVDASAIDSTVLELELSRRPEILRRIRVIDTFGPSPMPPWVISEQIPRAFQETIRSIFIQMEADPAGRAILEQGMLKRFARVEDKDYDPIRAMARLAEKVSL